MNTRMRILTAAAAVVLGLAPAPRTAGATTETAVVVSADGAANDDFGWSVAIEGPTLAVGAPLADIGGVQGQGAVYVFELVAGAWTQVQKLTASDGAEFDQFGFSVAISGDRMVIGAEEADINGNAAQGAAYIFERVGGTWTEVHKLFENTLGSFDEYGHDVDIEGDRIVIGASKGGSPAHGRTFIYERDQGGPGTWGQVQELEDDIFDSNAGFGESVDLEGDLLVVGALLLDRVPGTYNNEGGAYVFRRDPGSNTWSQVAKLFRDGALGNERCGISVALSGSTVVMGGYSVNGAGYGRGAAYVFENPGQVVDGWSQVAALQASDPQDFAYFGTSTAMFGRSVYVGAQGQDTSAGKAYRFDEDQGGVGVWGEADTYLSSVRASNDLFGYSLAVDADHLAVGAFVMGGDGAVLVFPGPGGAASPVGDLPAAPAGVAAFPNPFNPTTNLSFTIDHRGEVEVLIHDLRGALVSRLFRGELDAGRHDLTWRADGMPSGVYLATVRAGHTLRSTAVTLVK